MVSVINPDGNLPKKEKITVSDIIIYAIIAFLVAKFLGLTRTFLNVDPFGVNFEFVWAPMAVGIGVIYKELNDVKKNLVTYGERLARIEGKLEQQNKSRK